MLTKNCDYCGIEFERGDFKVNKTGKYFCSIECQVKYRKKYNCWTSKGVKRGKGKNPWSIHCWVRKHKPKPELCEFCNERPPKDLANLKNHEYTRNPDDYAWICQSCHQTLDAQNGCKRGNHKKGYKMILTEEERLRRRNQCIINQKKRW